MQTDAQIFVAYASRTGKHLIRVMTYYTEQLLYGAWAKALFAGVAVFFVEFLKGDIAVFNIYVIFIFFDLVLGITRAKMYGTYRPRLVCNWMKKVCTHLLIIFLFGLVCNSLFLTSGFVVPAVNWLLFCLTITECASILDHLRRMGLPIPPIIDATLQVLRRQASDKITLGIQDEGLRKQVEDALSNIDNKKGNNHE